MKKKGFTLIEAIIGLFLLGIIALTIIPIINSTYNMVSRNKLQLEMIYIGEMTVEKLKAFKEGSKEELYIYNTRVSYIVDSFSRGSSSFTIYSEDEKNYKIKIDKEDKNESIWAIHVVVSYEKGASYNEVEYKASLPRK